MIISTKKNYHREICSRSKKNQEVYKWTLTAAQKTPTILRKFPEDRKKMLRITNIGSDWDFPKMYFTSSNSWLWNFTVSLLSFQRFPLRNWFRLLPWQRDLFFFGIISIESITLTVGLYILILLVNIIFASPTTLPGE